MPQISYTNTENITSKLLVDEVNATLRAKKGRLPHELDKNSFVKLLVTQLRHQDPTQPMNDREFISQMAQFSTLEQMSNMNQSLERLIARSQFNEAFQLMGKEIEALDSVQQQVVRGIVTGVVFRNDGVKVVVNNHTEVSLSDIHSVHMPSNYRTQNITHEPNNINMQNTASNIRKENIPTENIHTFKEATNTNTIETK